MKRVLFFIVAAMFAGQAWGQSFEIGNLKYTVTGANTVSVAKGSTAPTGDVEISSQVTCPSDGVTYTVTSLARDAFKSCSNLTSVNIPNSVTIIGESAFEYCSGLTSVTFPNSITNIGDNAFYCCYKLTKADFASIKNLCEIKFDGLCSNPLRNAKLFINGILVTSVEIPSDVTSIGSYAFTNCKNITSITISDGVTSIDSYAFNYCTNLTKITIPNSVTTIGSYAFSGCHSLTSVTIPNSVTSIGERAFEYCSGLTTITIPNSVTSIGERAFYSCSGLTSATIGNSVTSIGDAAFKECGLTTVTIPESVTSIGDLAFLCNKLTDINVESGNTAYTSENGVFFNKAKTNLICYPAGKTETTYTIPSSVTSIAGDAFNGCRKLTSVTIPNSVTSIGERAFYYCSGLTSITIPNSVTSIGDWAFYSCSGLTSVTIPNSVTSIGGYAFYSCSGLTSATIPNSVTTIGSFAFNECIGLTSVTIPNSVTSIGGYAFSGCYSLTSVTIPNSVTNIDRGVFSGCSGLTSVIIPNSVTSIGDRAFYYCSGLTLICYEGNSEPTYQSNSFTNVDKTMPVYLPSEYASYSWCEFQVSKHNLITIHATPATCTETGLSEGRSCTCCEKVLIPQIEIPALGHNYGTPTYEWADDGSTCTAKTVCQRDAHHVLTEDAIINSEETIAPTCMDKGTTTYTAAFTDDKFSTQTKDVEDIDALGHDYGEPTYVWVNDGSACTATAVCQRDATHITTENATIKSGETIAATCEEMGTTTYTAAFENELFATQTKEVVNIPAKGHKADSIEIENFEAATCTTVGLYDSVVYCSVCQAEQYREEKEIPALGHTYSTTVTAPTCTAIGYTTHTCSVCEYTYNSDTVAANGHSYSTAITAPTCTAVGYTTHTCSVCEYAYNSDTVAANGHTEVTDDFLAATCTAAGKTEGKHCSVCNETIVAQTEIPALGHEFKDYIYNNDATTAADGTETATCTRGCGATDTRTAAGTKIATTPEKGTAVSDAAANAISIYTQNNVIVVENAQEEISVYDAMGRLVCRDAARNVSTEITVTTPGIYIVKVGGTAKRVMVND